MAKNFFSKCKGYAKLTGSNDLSAKQPLNDALPEDLEDVINTDRNLQGRVSHCQNRSRLASSIFKALGLALVFLAAFILGKLSYQLDENACIDTPWGKISSMLVQLCAI